MITEISKQERLIERFLGIRQQTESLTQPLQIEDFVSQPIQDVSPPKWHLGHSSWFFENFLLKRYAENYQPFSEDFAFLFNSYYESEGERLLRNKRGSLNRPTTEEVLTYRKHVDREMQALLLSGAKLDEDFYHFMELGIQHEQQHQELLVTDIKYILADNPLFPTYTKYQKRTSSQSPQEWLSIEAGLYEIGFKGEGFCFDNELGRHKVYLHDFRISNRLVSNEEYLDFIMDGGYENFEYWLSEGWEWLKESACKAPLYWIKKTGEWQSFQLNGLQKLDLKAPVCHLNYYEAEAFASWKGKRLPTESEWEIAAGKYGDLEKANSFLESGIYQSVVEQGRPNFFGSIWEWTSSDYAPYPFYKKAKGALGEYNGKFMVNQKVLRGGSCATPKSHFRPTYRNFFHPHLQWQFSGLRLAETIE